MTSRDFRPTRLSSSSMSVPRPPIPSLEDLISSVSSTNTHIISPPTSVHRQQTASSPSHSSTFPRIIRASNAPDTLPAQSSSASRSDIACTPPLSNSPTRARRPSAGPLSLRSPNLHRPGSHTHTTLSSPHLALHQSPPPFPRPPYLDHSSLRHLLQTELPPNLPPSRYTSTIYPFVPRPQQTSIPPALIDDSDAESTTASPPPGLPPSPPASASAKSLSETVSLVSSSPVFRLPTRWSEQDRHTYLSVSADGRELTYHG
jgi:Ran-binding protein 9/10